MPGLDGLRALAVFAVIAYHAGWKQAEGGLLGVGVFFVLSGYLITDQLISRCRRNGRLALGDFWLRRARRLLPAMLMVLAATTGYLAVFDPARLALIRSEVAAALTYMSNWQLIYHQVSYFESFGPPSPLGHLWSLAVEEQFYLIWPLLIAAGLRFTPRRGSLALITLVLATASVVAMALLYEPGTDPSRIYYGTDTRAFALFFGAALAMLWPSDNLASQLSGKRRLALESIGVTGLLTMLFMLMTANEYSAGLYPGGLVLLSVAAAATIAVLAHPASRLGKIMGCLPLRWLGVRSYGIYLWHYPVIVLTDPSAGTGEPDLLRSGLQVTASVLLAAASWKWVEEPILRARWKDRWTRIGRLFAGHRTSVAKKLALAIVLTVLFPLCLSCGGVVSGTEVSAVVSSPAVARPEMAAVVTPQAMPKAPNAVEKPEKKEAGGTPDEAVKPVSTKPQEVTAIGDSVILDAAPYLKKLLPGILVDGKVGRQMREAQDVVEQLEADGNLGSRVIIELGTNGTFTGKQMEKLIQTLGEERIIVLVNTRVPRPWQDPVNEALKKTAAKHDNVTLVNWHSFSAGKSKFFAKDGVHLQPKGASAYASLVAEAVNKE